EADKWLAKGLALIRRELDEQVLPDGGHFERSPMYHCILLEDLLDLLQLAALFPNAFPGKDVAKWRECFPQMLRLLRIMTHPDGEIAFFNDATIGVAPNYAALSAYASALSIEADEAPLEKLEPLRESGYVRMEMGCAVLIADVGEIGPDYIPGHAHADTLSFELSLNGRRVLVNGGISTYETGEERLRQRGTGSKNALRVNGADSSEVWSSFRVASRARPFDVSWSYAGGMLHLQAAHDGYARLGVRKTVRQWKLKPDSLKIVDKVEGASQTAAARFLAHPFFAWEQDKIANILSGTLGDGETVFHWRSRDAV